MKDDLWVIEHEEDVLANNQKHYHVSDYDPNIRGWQHYVKQAQWLDRNCYGSAGMPSKEWEDYRLRQKCERYEKDATEMAGRILTRESERDDALTRLRIEKELRVHVQEERDSALERIKDLGDEIKSLYAAQR